MQGMENFKIKRTLSL